MKRRPCQHKSSTLLLQIVTTAKTTTISNTGGGGGGAGGADGEVVDWLKIQHLRVGIITITPPSITPCLEELFH